MGSSDHGEEYQNEFSSSQHESPSPRRRTRQSVRQVVESDSTDTVGNLKIGDSTCSGGTLIFLTSMWHYTILPLLLMLIMPNFSLVIWHVATKLDGSILVCYQFFTGRGVLSALGHMWRSVNFQSPFAIGVVLSYSIWAVLLQIIIPGKRVAGPVTPKGNTPVYKDNGFFCYIITMVAFVGLTYILKTFYNTSPTLVYDHFGDIITCLSLFSLVLCVLLYFKGRFAPSTTDSGSSGNLIFDYYWGTELYPRIFGVDIKVFTNCRFGMTLWPLLICIFMLKNYELYGFVDSSCVSCLIQIIYITKFFWWEAGYMNTIDIMVDRAGFYLCWGCMTYVPCMYTSVSLFLVTHPVHLGPVPSCLILIAGVLSIAINYMADWQKQAVRNSKGNCLIWGKMPEIIHAKYRLETGESRESLLLVSGWWGIARHFHYIPELALAFCWSVPALFTHFQPYFYFFYLIILLVHRTYRDDEKCSKKYTHYWQKYCDRVPYKMIPKVF